MIGFVIAMLVFAGSIVALAGFAGQEMRADARKRDQVADLFISKFIGKPDGSSPSP